ncbi:hypothetical protein [Stieleria marina]|uniref:Uncharacterized protein n=1 Tax=Stieleria marina TaxID=1930275 RepID=A0A517NQ34_9BACT|nr:hypothetical protein K239x_11720 [Planctomycetes bacterium K23_9]
MPPVLGLKAPHERLMFGISPVEMFALVIPSIWLGSAIAGFVWSRRDASSGVYKPDARSLRIASVSAFVVICLVLVTMNGVGIVAGGFMTYLVTALFARTGYAIGPASANRPQRSAKPMRRYTNAISETGNPYQPPVSDTDVDT